ncbi:MAG TPA: septum site-determining protein Ssd [Jatrophihabitans sp.]|nr:septum site-determining protein Ssd [Jatrophihabitans sp.]
MTIRPVIGVLAGCGGAGASLFAAVLAGCAAERDGHAFLIDCDPPAGGIDVLLGCEKLPGPRWGQVRLAGGMLDPAVLSDSLPRWQQVSFLAADSAAPLDPTAVELVLAAAGSLSVVVLDLPRTPAEAARAAMRRCDLTVLVTVAEVRAVTAAAMVAAGLDPRRTVVLVRGSSRSLPPRHIGELLGLPVLGELPFSAAGSRPGGLRFEQIRRRTRRLAHTVLVAAEPDGDQASDESAGDPVRPGGSSAA